jgi:23S rRNA pseudouridine1911/1915/1917 synthase
MAYAGHPLLGDWLYGSPSSQIDRPALHAAALTFPHPITGETLTLRAPLPEDMKALLPREL